MSTFKELEQGLVRKIAEQKKPCICDQSSVNACKACHAAFLLRHEMHSADCAGCDGSRLVFASPWASDPCQVFWAKSTAGFLFGGKMVPIDWLAAGWKASDIHGDTCECNGSGRVPRDVGLEELQGYLATFGHIKVEYEYTFVGVICRVSKGEHVYYASYRFVEIAAGIGETPTLAALQAVAKIKGIDVNP